VEKQTHFRFHVPCTQYKTDYLRFVLPARLLAQH